MKKVYWRDYKIEVIYNGIDFNPQLKREMELKFRFETTLQEYLILFNQLPLVGTEVGCSDSDDLVIKSIMFTGISKIIRFYIQEI